MDSSQSFDVLCSACQAMFDEDTHRDLLIEPKDNVSVLGLHLTITTLMASATRGCHLCSVLCGSFKLSRVAPDDAQLLGTIWRHLPPNG